MRLLGNWREVLKRAWSVRLMFLAAILSGLEVTCSALVAFAMVPSFIPVGLFAALAGVVTLAALVARFFAQGISADG